MKSTIKNIIIKTCLLMVLLLVLSAIVNAEICECNSCKDCTEKLNSTSCTEVKLIKDINIYQPEDFVENPWEHKNCIFLMDTENKIFDCQENKIKLHQTMEEAITIINVLLLKNITIKNCEISGISESWRFLTGINIGLTNNSNLINNTVFFCQTGISLGKFAYNNTISGNNLFFNGIGLRLWRSSYNNISKNSIFSNGCSISDRVGISLGYESNFNEVSANKIYNNTGPGILITGIGCEGSCRGYPGDKKGIGNKIMNNEITKNTYGILSALSEISVYSNTVCWNEKSDFSSSDWMDSRGNNNTCNISDGWNDDRKEGCTYKCKEQKPPDNNTEPDYNIILAIVIILITILLSAFIIRYKKFKK